MAGRRLHPDEQMLWHKVAQTVRPLPGRAPVHSTLKSLPATGAAPTPPVQAGAMPAKGPAPLHAKPVRRPVDVLDGSWERRITGGALVPDATIDLHGHTLDAAHRRLDMALSSAVAHHARVLLVVTGKPRPGPAIPGERARGAIRAEIHHWIAISPHADAIASVRTAHPRHGGTGALYIILRRGR